MYDVNQLSKRGYKFMYLYVPLNINVGVFFTINQTNKILNINKMHA